MEVKGNEPLGTVGSTEEKKLSQKVAKRDTIGPIARIEPPLAGVRVLFVLEDTITVLLSC